MKARFIRRIGTRVRIHKSWGECPLGAYEGARHTAFSPYVVLKVTKVDLDEAAKLVSFEGPVRCETCGEAAPDSEPTGAGTAPLYDTEGGWPEPGDLYYGHGHDADEWCWMGWENCSGRHLVAVLPNGREWQIDQRASNCTMPHDKTHRCWVRHGDPEKGEPVHVDKNGRTCQAGAGSIMAGDYHGFLHHGEFEEA